MNPLWLVFAGGFLALAACVLGVWLDPRPRAAPAIILLAVGTSVAWLGVGLLWGTPR